MSTTRNAKPIFIQYPSPPSGSKDAKLPSCNEAPIFLFPDISGHGDTIMNLAAKLYEKLGTRVFVLYDPLLNKDDKNLTHEFSYENDMNAITHDMEEIKKLYQDQPLIVAGYSYGCLQAQVCAQLFTPEENHNQDIFLYTIDAPQNPKTYIEKIEKFQFISDLVDIANYAARLCNFKEGQDFSDMITSQLENEQDIYKQMQMIADEIAKCNSEKNADDFYRLILIMSRNLNYQTHNIDEILKEKQVKNNIHSIRTFAVDSTINKYEDYTDKHLGWENLHPKNFETNFESNIKDQAHTDLMQECNVEVIANDLSNWISGKLNAKYYYDKDFANMCGKIKSYREKGLFSKEHEKKLQEVMQGRKSPAPTDVIPPSSPLIINNMFRKTPSSSGDQNTIALNTSLNSLKFSQN